MYRLFGKTCFEPFLKTCSILCYPDCQLHPSTSLESLQKRRSNEDSAEDRVDAKEASEHGDDLEDFAEDRDDMKDASKLGDDFEEAADTRDDSEHDLEDATEPRDYPEEAAESRDDHEHAEKTKRVQDDRNKEPYRITKKGPESAAESNMLGTRKRANKSMTRSP